MSVRPCGGVVTWVGPGPRELVNGCVLLGEVIIGSNVLCLLAHCVDHSKHTTMSC